MTFNLFILLLPYFMFGVLLGCIFSNSLSFLSCTLSYFLSGHYPLNPKLAVICFDLIFITSAPVAGENTARWYFHTCLRISGLLTWFHFTRVINHVGHKEEVPRTVWHFLLYLSMFFSFPRRLSPRPVGPAWRAPQCSSSDRTAVNRSSLLLSGNLGILSLLKGGGVLVSVTMLLLSTLLSSSSSSGSGFPVRKWYQFSWESPVCRNLLLCCCFKGYL